MLGCAGCEWQQAAGRGGFGVMQGWLEEQAANSCRQIPEPCTRTMSRRSKTERVRLVLRAGRATAAPLADRSGRGGRCAPAHGVKLQEGVLRALGACVSAASCWFPPRTRMRARGRAPRRLAWWRPRCWRCWWATTRAGPWGGGVRRACLASIPPAACWAAAQRRLMCAGPGRPAPRGCLAGR